MLPAQYPGGYPGGGYPGQYPGGGYPGGYPGGGGGGLPIPRRGKKSTTNDKDKNKVETTTVTGVLRSIDNTTLSMTANDRRAVSAKLTDKTAYYSGGNTAKAGVFRPGDHVHIDVTADEHGFFTAVAVYLDSEGSAQERAAAGRERESVSQAAEEDIAEQRASNLGSSGSRVGPAAGATDASPDADPNRPKIRRGRPAPKAQRSSDDDDAPASAAPPVQTASAKLPEGTASARAAANRTSADTDPRITKAREVLANYLDSLPNYYCREQIARFQSTTKPVDWQAVDVVAATVVYEGRREQYRDLTINGKPVKQGMEQLTGAWSTGEFASTAMDLFHPATDADFAFSKNTKIANHDAVVFDFEVPQERSHWKILVASQYYMPAYRGSVWLDKNTGQILRIEMQGRKLPKDFPIDSVESAVDFDYVRIAEMQYLLPTHAESLSCERGTQNCSRNVIDFRNYHKYSGQSTITF